MTVRIYGLPQPKKRPPQPYCSNHKRFKGLREPTCLGGPGCFGCWTVYFTVQEDLLWKEVYAKRGG